MFNPRASRGSKTMTQPAQFEGTGASGATLKDGPLPRPTVDKDAPVTIIVTSEQVQCRAKVVEDCTIAQAVKVDGVIEHEDYVTDGSEGSDASSLDGSTIIDAKGQVDANSPLNDAAKTGIISMILAGSTVESKGIKFSRKRGRKMVF